MRVNHPNGNAVQGSETSSTKQSGRAAAAQEGKHAEKAGAAEVEKGQNHSVNAEISAKSKEFANVKAAATNAPDVRDERIAELKRKIAEGSYKVDTDAIADRMVDDHLKMSGIS